MTEEVAAERTVGTSSEEEEADNLRRRCPDATVVVGDEEGMRAMVDREVDDEGAMVEEDVVVVGEEEVDRNRMESTRLQAWARNWRFEGWRKRRPMAGRRRSKRNPIEASSRAPWAAAEAMDAAADDSDSTVAAAVSLGPALSTAFWNCFPPATSELARIFSPGAG